jgi:hypothetical protein
MVVENCRWEGSVASYRQPLAVLALIVIRTVALGQSANHVLGAGPPFCVSGEPFSATETLDYEPSENSSDPVAVHRDGTLYRDSEGRTRTELKYPGYPAVFIQDCVAHRIYDWRVETQSCVVGSWRVWAM